ncbi:hypothetical protein FOPG_09772 [Fusarium oxysporum f. sp. conglutinans race 2 54008]|uniref:Uncharacterized protein n=2 Tax=Fusarium oxysporum f. sp. conglutinans TaxID=100902 RepID=A0A8H6LER8_FUSOX|nr:hypothetical protein FOPG_09772 [Fusarium oxysporum f. sp. conglutinans race 2 54008]KAF6516305.1 hypothetical protein HZS61_003508 [Fusarium oxysporum f. sp. conglutinans]KAG6982816.1 hypothetical protein FocnCong_v006464 [Fusarium oxysporum f. sp. conglutinans]KAI8402847.1 hypothetical protein FOFC_16276 [Fusarium oxysporum]
MKYSDVAIGAIPHLTFMPIQIHYFFQLLHRMFPLVLPPLYYPKALGKVAVEELKDLIGTTLKDPRPEKPRKNSQNTEEQGPVVTPLISLQVLLPQTKNTVHLITEESGLAVERKVLGSRLVEASL